MTGPVRRVQGTGGPVLLLVAVLALVAVGCSDGEPPDLGGDDSVPVVDDDTSTTPSTAAAGGEDPPTGDADEGGDEGAGDGDDEVEVSSGLPEGWPDDLPIPDDAVLQLGQRTPQEDDSVLLTADFSVEDGGANVHTSFLEALQDGGATILQRSSGGTDGGFVGSISFTSSGYTGNVAVDEVDGTTLLSVSVVVDE